MQLRLSQRQTWVTFWNCPHLLVVIPGEQSRDRWKNTFTMAMVVMSAVVVVDEGAQVDVEVEDQGAQQRAAMDFQVHPHQLGPSHHQTYRHRLLYFAESLFDNTARLVINTTNSRSSNA